MSLLGISLLPVLVLSAHLDDQPILSGHHPTAESPQFTQIVRICLGDITVSPDAQPEALPLC